MNQIIYNDILQLSLLKRNKYVSLYANLNFESKLNFVRNNKPVPVVARLWSDISDLDLEKMLCHFFSTSAAVLPGPTPMAVNETAMFRHVRLFIFEVSYGPNFPLNICLFSSTTCVSASVSSAFQLGFLFLCESIVLTFSRLLIHVTVLTFLPFSHKSAFVTRETPGICKCCHGALT